MRWDRVAGAIVSTAFGLMASVVAGCTSPDPCPDVESGLRALADQRGLEVSTAYRVAYATEDECYEPTAVAEFNALTPEIATLSNRIAAVEGSYDFSEADAICGLAEEHDERCHAHDIIWDPVDHPEWGIVPGWIRNQPPDRRRATMISYVSAVASHFRGRASAYTLVNEAFDGAGQLTPSIWNTSGDDSYIFDAFRAARLADPEAELFYNDFGAEDINAKSDAIFDLAQRLRAETVAVEIDGELRDVPLLDGVGLQMHVGIGPGQAPDPASVAANIERLGQAGLLVRITEMDVRLPVDDDGQASEEDLERQRDSYTRLVSACLDATNCDGVTLWGFTDAHSWITENQGSFPGVAPRTRSTRRTTASPPTRASRTRWPEAGVDMADRTDTHDGPDDSPTRPPEHAWPSLPRLPTASAPADRPLPARATPPIATWRTSRLVVGAVAAVAFVAVATVAAIAARDRPTDRDRGLEGAPIADPAAVLRHGEEAVHRYLQRLTARGIETTRGDLYCWFAHPSSRADPLEQLWCGPVVFADSTPGTSWLQVPVGFEREEDRTRASVGDVEFRRTWALPAGFELRRLERDEWLTADDVEGPGRPGVVDAEPSAVEVVPTADTMVDMVPPDDGRISGAGYSWEITGVATTGRIFVPGPGSGPGEVVGAAEGEEWLLFHLTIADDHDIGSDVAVVVDGAQRIPLADDASGNLPRAGVTDEGVIAVSVPTAAQDIALVIADGTNVQTWSFPTQ